MQPVLVRNLQTHQGEADASQTMVKWLSESLRQEGLFEFGEIFGWSLSGVV